MEVLHAESQSLPGEVIMCHQEMMVTLLKIGKGKQKIHKMLSHSNIFAEVKFT